MGAECIAMRPSDALKGVRREHRARKNGCYVMLDKHGKYLLLAQKLQVIASFLNSVASDDASRVSVTALYEICDTSASGRVGGFCKYRWKLRFASLDDAARLLERERARFEHAFILGQPECYQIAAVDCGARE